MKRSEPQARLVETVELDGRARGAARILLGKVFGSEMTEHDWEHCLGGVHTLVYEGDELVGHGAVVPRRLRHAGRVLRTGYVEGLAVKDDRRGRGYGATIMDRLEEVIRNDYEIGALSTTEQAGDFYASRGWTLWRGPTSAITPRGVVRTPDDDGGIYVLPVSAPLDIYGDLTCDWRAGDLW